ncbi:hypothetical protein NA56DRAFT_570060, partial [Hyaloscypha hepaticicola]
WADGPFPLLETPRKRRLITDLKKEPGALAFATEMCLVHNVFIRTLNCIYLQAPNVTLETDALDFATFIHAFVFALHEHHRTEEKFAFPWLEELNPEVKKYMDKNVEQHHEFEPGLQALQEYATALREGKVKYDGAKVLSLIDAFSNALLEHLKEEVTSFEELEKLGDTIDWVKWGKRVQRLAVDNAETEFAIPLVVTNIDRTFEDGWHQTTWPPPVPWFVPYIFRWIYLPKHKGAWRFSCCDWYGKPKELEFI